MRDRIARLMDDAWRDPGFCVPNGDTYPHQWLWDSCFHALVWLALGSDRAVTEVGNALSRQDPSGFVPHMIYWHRPDLHARFWGRPGTSIITQPPMFGHALAEAARAGVEVPDELVARAVAGIRHLTDDRDRTPAGLIPVFHPWETGCDDSLRWDSFLPPAGGRVGDAPSGDAGSGAEAGLDEADDTAGDLAPTAGPEPGEGPEPMDGQEPSEGPEPMDGQEPSDGPEPMDRADRWRVVKEELVAELERGPDGHAVDGRRFRVGSIGFNALVVWNGRELIDAFPAAASGLAAPLDDLGRRIAERWDGTTWVDDGPPSGRARTLDALLGALVDPRPEALAQLTAADGFGARCGPRGAHRDEARYRPDVYWRGPAWPQLSYLAMVAADRAGLHEVAAELAEALVRGADRSGFAEYWHPDTGAGLGAVPQTWAGLALLAGGGGASGPRSV